MIIQLTDADATKPLHFINTDHIVTLTHVYEWNDEGTQKWCVESIIKLSDGTTLRVDNIASETIEHYLKLQYLKDSAEVCGKLGIEETE